MSDLHTLNNGVCSTCGSSEMCLAEDYTTYSQCTYNAETGKFSVRLSDNPSPSEHDNAVRFFCFNCGSYFSVPEELL